MSFDEKEDLNTIRFDVSIPLEQGNVFRRLEAFKEDLKQEVSIPLEQGNVFRQEGYNKTAILAVSIPLEQGNVFRQYHWFYSRVVRTVSIPLEQGNVFRPLQMVFLPLSTYSFQSL